MFEAGDMTGEASVFFSHRVMYLTEMQRLVRRVSHYPEVSVRVLRWHAPCIRKRWCVKHIVTPEVATDKLVYYLRFFYWTIRKLFAQ